ncbi:unnamed protein product [Acanthoscelides obtectus]|nr:unnamed protein product [Acanthoscelides obtectus]CAK1634974.1 hypothetical protein AOBTE_LOCUS8982 [Acanthoscelides obtectus]
MLLDQALAINRSMQENLSNELNEKSTLEIKTATKLKVTKNKTDELAKNLDAINININSQLVKYGQCINDFMYGTQQTLMLTIEDSCQEKVELLSNSIMPILIRPSDETEDSSMFMESTLWISENSRRDMQHDSVKQRLIQSKLNYIVSKTSLETTSKLFDYLMSVKFESLMLLEPMEEIENKIYLKNGRERVMYSMLENIIVDTTGRQVSNSKLRYLQAALANFQSQLKTITELEDLSVLLLAHYHILLIMCSSQTDDIDFSVQFFKKIFYLSNDLQNCENRIEKMRSTIQMYEAEKPDDKFRFIKHVTRIVFGEEFEAKSGLQKILYLKDTLEDLRYRLFSPEFREERSSFLEMKNDLKTLRSFLVPGPTSEVVLVPIELQKMVQSVREHLERQRRCLRTAITVFQSRRKLSKWENHRRLLWTYFYSNPQKLLLVLQEIENEVPSVNSNSKMATLIE